ncbi:P-loop containing nucleoside triphosphate hydrolase protein [Haematococcus lacustris]
MGEGGSPEFEWRDRVHGSGLRWLVLVEDSANEHLYHSEVWLLTRKMALQGPQQLAFTIPIFEPLPPQYYVRVISEEWLHAEALLPLSFQGLILPERMPPHTELLDLDPLPLSALSSPAYQALYSGRFTHFNPIQTQAFHCLYHSDEAVLLGAPTGSGKTISSELTMMRLWNTQSGVQSRQLMRGALRGSEGQGVRGSGGLPGVLLQPGRKVIYIAPLKALVRERMEEWGRGLCAALGKNMVELTGAAAPWAEGGGE